MICGARSASRRGANDTSTGSAAGLVLVQITSVQLGAAIAKDLFGRTGPTGTAGLRIGWTALVLCALARPRLRGLDTGQLAAALGLGLVVAAMNVTYFHAIARIPMGVAASLELLGPLGLSLVLSRRPTDLLWAGLSITGLLLLALPRSELDLAGLVFGAVAGLLRAGYVLLNQRVGELFVDWSGLAIAMTTGAMLLVPTAVLSSGGQLAHAGILTRGLIVAMLSSLAPYSLDLLTLRRITSHLFGILLSASPAVAAMVGYAVLSESLTTNQLLAVGLIAAGNIAAVRQVVTFAGLTSNRRPRPGKMREVPTAQKPRTVDEHIRVVAALLASTPVIRLPLVECAGLALAEPITAAIPLPPFDNSGMDGYAVRCADIAQASDEAPVVLPVTEDIPAGRTDSPVLQPGTAHRIMTGAPIPPGADAVVPVELTDGGRHRVQVYAPRSPGDSVRPGGGDVTKGEEVLPAGAVLGPAQLGVAAAVGYAELPVHRPVRVLVLSTGSELVVPGTPLQHGQIYESNGTMLAAAVREAGGQAQLMHFVPDDVAALEAALAPRLAGIDLLVTSGGVSAGAYEVVKSAMTGQGVDFGKVAMNPGAPQGVGRYRGVPVAAMPGNPVSASVSFEVFVRPALRAAMGLPVARERTMARLTEDLESPGDKRQFRRGAFDPAAGSVAPVGGPGSHLLGALARSNCLIDIPETTTSVRAGEYVEVMRTGSV